jgi:hypothetical protein
VVGRVAVIDPAMPLGTDAQPPRYTLDRDPDAGRPQFQSANGLADDDSTEMLGSPLQVEAHSATTLSEPGIR